MNDKESKEIETTLLVVVVLTEPTSASYSATTYSYEALALDMELADYMSREEEVFEASFAPLARWEGPQDERRSPTNAPSVLRRRHAG